MKRTHLLQLWLGFIVILTSTMSCQLPTGSSTTTDGRTTISFAVRDHHREIYETFAKKFMSEYPELHVVIISKDELIDQLLAQDPQPGSLAQQRWILSHADTTLAGNLTEMSEHDLILDLLPLMAADAGFERADFYPNMLDQYMTAEHLWALPNYRAVHLLSYNKDLFEQLDVPMPELGWSWRELLGTAEQLARKQDGTVIVGGLLASLSNVVPLLESALEEEGTDLADMPPEQVKFQHETLIDTIMYIRRLQETGALVVPRDLNPDVEPAINIYELHQSGQLGMWSSGYFTPGDDDGDLLPEEGSFTVGKTAYPPDEHYFGAVGEGYVVSAGTAYPDASWQWIEFLSRQPAIFETASVADPGAFLVPARQSVAEATNFWEQLDDETAAAVRWSVEHAIGEADRPRYAQALTTLSTLAYDLFDKPELDAQELVAQAEEKFEDEVAKTLLTPTPQRSGEPLAVATPEPPINSDERDVITFAVYGRSYINLRQRIKTFNEQQTNVFIKLEGNNTFGSASSIDGLAQTSDCFMWTGTFPTDETEMLLDLQPLISAETRLAINDYPGLLLTPYQLAGNLYGLPYTVQLRALHYQRDLFAANGVGEPTAAWTPDDFLAAAQALTAEIRNAQQYGYVPYSGAIPDLLFFIQQFGGEVLHGSGDNFQPNFRDPAVITAIEWYLDLDRVYGVMPPLHTLVNESGGGSETALDLVRHGRAGMWFGPGTLMFGAAEDGTELTFTEALAPLPVGNAGLHPGDTYIQSLHISGQTEYPQACWEWLVFLSNDASMIAWPGVLPARSSVAQAIDLPPGAPMEDQRLFQIHTALLAEHTNSIHAHTTIDMQSPVLQWFFQALHAVITEDANLAEELATAEQSTTVYIDCLTEGVAEDDCVEQANMSGDAE